MTWKPEEWIEVSGKLALTRLEELRRERQFSGFVPILMGTPDEFKRISADYELNVEDLSQRYETALEQASAVSVREWLRERLERDGPPEEAAIGKWPLLGKPRVSQIRLATHRDVLSNKPFPKVILGLYQVSEPWMVLGRVLWNAYNYDIGPEVHMAFFRHWQETFGAEVVSVTDSVVQCVVERRPSSKVEAMELATQQYALCPDNVDQGHGTIVRLAAALIKSDYWYFWWD